MELIASKNYMDFAKRLETLKPVFSEAQSYDLARLGFYFDQVKNFLVCFCCNLSMDKNDINSTEKHQENSQNCVFLNMTGQNYQRMEIDKEKCTCGERADHEWVCDVIDWWGGYGRILK